MNKDIAVFMTRKEYEEYEKYLSLRNECFSIKLSYSVGMAGFRYELGVLNKNETINLLNKQIEELREENKIYYEESIEAKHKFENINKSKKWYQL